MYIMFNSLKSTSSLLILALLMFILGLLLLLSPEYIPSWVLRVLGGCLILDAIGFAVLALQQRAWDEYDKFTEDASAAEVFDELIKNENGGV